MEAAAYRGGDTTDSDEELGRSGHPGVEAWSLRAVVQDALVVLAFLLGSIGSEYAKQLFPQGQPPIAVTFVLNISEWVMVIAAARHALIVIRAFVVGFDELRQEAKARGLAIHSFSMSRRMARSLAIGLAVTLVAAGLLALAITLPVIAAAVFTGLLLGSLMTFAAFMTRSDPNRHSDPLVRRHTGWGDTLESYRPDRDRSESKVLSWLATCGGKLVTSIVGMMVFMAVAAYAASVFEHQEAISDWARNLFEVLFLRS